ncbi:hypothetical protein SZ64_04345 [Erythrobacter sp. SG61-1L]|nr:hypothetical protein SZ64_04345 [Erythrobacter sp. SG61-1L]
MAIGTGSKGFTLTADAAFVSGQGVVITSNANPTTHYMVGTITAYNSGTDALTVNVTSSAGSGTRSDWTIGLLPNSNALLKSGGTMEGKLGMVASASGGASANMPAGAAPSSPADGDEWATTAGRFHRMNGATRQYVFADGVHEIPIPATAMTRRTTNGPAVGSSETTTNKIMVETLDFDASTAEYAQIRFLMPKRWDKGTVKVQYIWTATTTGNVVWACRAVAISDDDPIDAAFGTAQSVTDGVTAANDVMVSAQSSAITVGGSPANGDMVVFEFYRDAANGSDTLAADAKLLGVRIILTTDAADDS